MGVRFACHSCGKQLNVKQELAGKRGRCPTCGTRFRIPMDHQDQSIPLDETVERGSLGADTDAEVPYTEAEEPEFDPLDDSSARWYVRPPNGGRYGPADGVTIRQWISEGRVTASTLLWRDGWAQWRELVEVVPEAFAGQPASAEVAKTQPPVTTTGSKVVPGSVGREADAYLGAKKRRKAKQRVTLIAILVALSLLLVLAIVVAMVWNGGDSTPP
jgi:DNA-directed RNA polymerase subunit RPC12/RpoP